MIKTVLNEEETGTRKKEGQGAKMDEEEGVARMKLRRGGLSDEEEVATKRVKK